LNVPHILQALKIGSCFHGSASRILAVASMMLSVQHSSRFRNASTYVKRDSVLPITRQVYGNLFPYSKGDEFHAALVGDDLNLLAGPDPHGASDAGRYDHLEFGRYGGCLHTDPPSMLILYHDFILAKKER
jgi:hypothetical protein